MSAPLELTGQRFGKLLVLGESAKRNGKTYWSCQCDCGKVKEIHGVNLKRGNTTSCGCGTFRFPTKHGLNDTPEYQAWADMLTRCRNPKNRQWYLYGGRGITVCPRWTGVEGPKNFYDDMGPRPLRHSLDRINTDGNYEPGNCRWATTAVQANNKRTNHLITFNNETLTVSEWGHRTKLGVPTIFSRLRLDWTMEQVLTRPKESHRLSLEYRNRQYSLAEAARKSGISAQTIKNRMNRGFTLEQAMKRPPRRLVENEGWELPTREWSAKTGIPKPVINARLRAGWEVERALTEPVAPRRKRRSPPT